MTDLLNSIIEKYSIGKQESYIEGLRMASSGITEIVNLSMRLLEEKKIDGFVFSEQISTFFNAYIEKLQSYLTSKDQELVFWAACLICHHGVESVLAKETLLSIAQNGHGEQFYVATTILGRRNEKKLFNILEMRLNSDVSLNLKERDFINEKLGG